RLSESPDHFLDPVNTLEPPMPEQLGVVVRSDDAVFPGVLLVLGQQVADEPHEVRRMVLDALGGLLRVVDRLVTEIGARPSHAPILHAGDAILAMELPVPFVAGIAKRAGPHLLSRSVVAPEDGDAPRLVTNPVRLERCPWLLLLLGRR